VGIPELSYPDELAKDGDTGKIKEKHGISVLTSAITRPSLAANHLPYFDVNL
jgi:hypothetical protein